MSYSPQALKIAEFYGYIVVDVNLDTKDFEAGETKSKLDLALQQYSTLTKKSTKKDSFISLQVSLFRYFNSPRFRHVFND